MKVEFAHELAVAVELARQAAVKILTFYALEIVAEEKIGADNFSEPVTIADRTASRIIVEGLSAAFPDDAILSEEEPDETENRVSKNRVWMIDPIDGTSGFIERNGDFAVQIGLIENGAPVVGVVLLPASDTLYYAVKNQGAFAVVGEGQPEHLRVSETIDFERLIMISSRSHRNKNLDKISHALGLKTEIRRGSVGLKIGIIAERGADLYIHTSPRTKFWDTCAPQIILEEAGGKLTDLFGEKIDYTQRDVQNHNGVLSSNGAVHPILTAKIKLLLNEFGRLRVKSQANKN